VRLVAAILCWLVATTALAVAVPAGWAQRHLIDADGYAALAYSAAQEPALRDAMASELSTQVRVIARNRGYQVNDDMVRAAAAAYTASSAFPTQFADVNRTAHAWLFTKSVPQNDGQLEIDIAPMLSSTSLRETLSKVRVEVPSTVTVPVTQDATTTVRPGQLATLATWGPWVSLGVAVLAGVAAFLTIAVAVKRGRALAALGVSALLVGGGGWAAMEVGRRYIGNALNQTTGNVRTIADVMVTNAEAGLHHWLNLTLTAGGALVLFGVIVTALGAALRGKQPR
jgi:hypothetical protein